MEDIDILKQLLQGLHLNEKELERAIKLLYLLEIELKNRIK